MEPASPNDPPPPSLPASEEEPTAITHVLLPPHADARHFHHYEICLREDGTTLHELGRGAMGVSYKARDRNLDTPVAIKVISASLPGQMQARERFRREARAAAQLRHPNVASVYHFGETPTGDYFYAMEFIDGETLAARLQREGPFPAALVVEIGLQVTAALIAADERGLVHRDLKPANIMLTRVAGVRTSGRTSSGGSAAPNNSLVKVIDFGLAKAAAGTAAGIDFDASLTQEGGFLGTPAYASPEQAEGGQVDARSDIYSLGVTLWYLLTGKVPFTGRSFNEIYDRQLHRALPVAQLTDNNVPAPLVKLLTSMLAANPERRPESPGALYEALEDCRMEIGGPPRVPREHPARATSRRSRSVFVTAIFIALTLLLAGVGGAIYFVRFHPAVAPAAAGANPAIAAPDKSIAVLPLEDFSEDKSNAYFADGIQDDLLSSLAKIKDLKVISRSSVMSYRNAAARNLREIGQQLGVTTILEGSVRRAPDRVLVNVALIEIASGRQLWAEHYDRTLADSLSLQGELATEIAAALRATLSPEEKARVEEKPTDNADAYVLYLRARDHQMRPTGLLQDYQAAESLYGQAIALDPAFSLAHARLSACFAYSYLNFEPTAENHDRARAEAEEALRLRPDSGEGHLARALCLYWTEKNYDAALRELETVGRLLPGDAEIGLYSGAIRRRQGRWSQSLADMRHALVRDPRAVLIAREIMLSDCMLRDWPTAARDGARAVALAPDLPLLQIEKSYVNIWAAGDLAPLRAALASAPPGVDPDGEVTFARWDAALLRRDYTTAENAVTSSATETLETVFGAVVSKNYLLGCVALARGDRARAQTLLEDARSAMETEARNVPLDAFRQAYLGVLYAFLGRKDDAIRQGRRAIELLPESKDALNGPGVTALLALIYARTGEVEQAITLIERLLTLPAPLSMVFDASITINDLRMRWQWDPLRADPRFRALLAGPEPKTIHN